MLLDVYVTTQNTSQSERLFMESLPPRHSVNEVSQCPMSWTTWGMIKNMTLPLLLEINVKDNYFHISINCLGFMYRMYIPPWVTKKFQIYSVKITENVFPSLEFTILTARIRKKLSFPNFYTKSQVFLPFLSKASLPPKVSQFSEVPTSPLFPNMIWYSVP